jgi:hypothetical protein
MTIDGVIKRTDGPLTSSECSVCGVECAVGMSFACKVFGVWHQWRSCKACAKAEGELQDERAQEAIRIAERSGV